MFDGCRKILQQDFDATLAYCNHERKQRSEESSSTTDWKNLNLKPQVLLSANSRQLHSRKHCLDSSSLSDSKTTESSSRIFSDELSAVNSSISNSTSKVTERQPSIASAGLLGLTTRLDFFKERRSQLMEQLHNLDSTYGASQGMLFKTSPPWTSSPR